MRATALLAVGLAAVLSTAGADVVHLKDGRKLEGLVEREEPERIFLKLRGGGLWIDRSEVDQVEKKPVDLGQTGKAPKGPPPFGLDYNLLQRAVFSQTRAVHPQLAERIWKLPLHAELVAELKNPFLRATAFRLRPQALDGLTKEIYQLLYLRHDAAAARELDHWYAAGLKRAWDNNVIAMHRKVELPELSNLLVVWMRDHPDHKFPRQHAAVKQLANRLAWIEDQRTYYAKWRQKDVVLERLAEDQRFYEAYFRYLLSPDSSLEPYMRASVLAARHKSAAETAIELSAEGGRRLREGLGEIAKRLRKDTVDEDSVLFDPLQLGMRGFNLLGRTDGSHPHLLRRHRYLLQGQPVVDHYYLRVGKLVYQVLVQGQVVWYAPPVID